MQEFGPIGGLVVGAFGEASADVLTLIQRTALFNAERNGLPYGAAWAPLLSKTGPRSWRNGPSGLWASKAFAVLPERGSRICRTSAPITGSRGLIADARRPITKTHGKPITNGLGLVRTTNRAADNTPPSLEGSGAGGWFPASLPKIG